MDKMGAAGVSDKSQSKQVLTVDVGNVLGLGFSQQDSTSYVS